MPRKNRAYKKGELHRDARLFVIVAEGEREDGYFQWFNERNQRIRVQLVEREENRSAPSHFLTRLNQFIERTGWSQQEDDQLWFVLDVDRWTRESITELQTVVEQTANWRMAISNPCFEVWIHYHIKDRLEDTEAACADLKQQLHEQIPGGYNPDTVCLLLETARRNAANADQNANGYYPDRMITKVYQLAEQLLQVLGNNWR